MKRHPALHPLSRDHHNVLVHARRLRGLDARIDPASAQRAFLAYFDAVLLAHFEEEEALVGPRIRDAALRQRLVDDHADLRRRAQALPHASAQDQVDLGQRLREHVRFEEDHLYPHLEAACSEADWQAVGAGSLELRRRLRPASLDGGAEACFLGEPAAKPK